MDAVTNWTTTWWTDDEYEWMTGETAPRPINEDQTGAPEWWARHMNTDRAAARARLTLTLWVCRGRPEDHEAVRSLWPDVPEDELRSFARAMCSRGTSVTGARTRLSSEWLPNLPAAQEAEERADEEWFLAACRSMGKRGSYQPSTKPIQQRGFAAPLFKEALSSYRWESSHDLAAVVRGQIVAAIKRGEWEEAGQLRRLLDHVEGREATPALPAEQEEAVRKACLHAIQRADWDQIRALRRALGDGYEKKDMERIFHTLTGPELVRAAWAVQDTILKGRTT